MQATALLLGEGGAPGAARLFASAPLPRFQPTADPSSVERGRAIVEDGLWERGVPPCASCHGLGQWDRGRIAPVLHDQREGYIAHELGAYADGTRRSDPMGRMRAFAAAMSEAERTVVASYYGAFSRLPAGQGGE